MRKSPREQGKEAESLVMGYLVERGYKVLAENFRSRYCEVDLVAREGDSLVFIEVKTGKREYLNLLSGKIDRKKQEKLITCAKLFCLKNFKSLSKIKSIRFDVIFVDLERGEINHYEGAFFADDELISF